MAGKASFNIDVGYGATPTYIAKIISAETPEYSRDALDTTNHDSGGWREFIPSGVTDPGEISCEALLVHGASNNRAILEAKFVAGTEEAWTFKFPDGTKMAAASGFLTKLKFGDHAVDGKQTFTFTIKLSGAITWTEAP